MDKNELLHHALIQNQYLKNYDEANPKESYDKVRNSFNNLFKKVCEYWNDEYSDEKDKGDRTYSLTSYAKDGTKIGEANNATITNTPIKKDGNPRRVQPWRELRNEKIKKLYKEAVANNIAIDDNFCFRVAQEIGTNRNKVKEVINILQFDEL